ncbi:hypothetical protein [Pseudomonas sp. NPDC099000]|uniref:hypothetical protein n=1 Tax=Pseudomonas sp. NPDC099000 TaxID=3364488 RepID=UPI00383A16BC
MLKYIKGEAFGLRLFYWENQKIAAFGSAHRRVGAAEGCDLLILVFDLFDLFDLFGITPITNQSSSQRDFLLPGSVLSGEPGQSELNFTQYLSGIHASPKKGWNRL